MADVKIDVKGETCPVPLVEMRKALRKAAPGEIVEVEGTHPASKKEIPMAVEALGSELVDVEEKMGYGRSEFVNKRIEGEING